MDLEYQVTFGHVLKTIWLTAIKWRLLMAVVRACVMYRLVFHKAPYACSLRMYADDTSIYVIGPTLDTVIGKLNLIIGELTKWCRNYLLTPHPGKTEFM